MAGGGAASSSDKKKARIEIIPLIDVVFFLLATFVLFTLSLNKIQSLPVNLPVAVNNPKPPDPNDDTVVIQVSDAGTIYWNKELINMSEVPPRLFQYKQNSANPRVLVTGDDRAKFGPTISVLDEVRKAGIAQVSVETTFRPTGK